MSEPDVLIRAQGVTLRYPDGTLALDGVSFEIARGEMVALVGPSGCGKSTLLRAVGGLLPITHGTLEVAGLDPVAARKERCKESFVFQDSTLLPWRTVEDNVRLPLELEGSQPQSWPARIADALALVGLSAAARQRPAQLSGGMQMRTSLARALVTRPDLLLLDEPFGALDELTRERLDEELLALRQAQGWTGLAVTHSVQEAVFLSTRVLVLSRGPGRVVADLRIDLPSPRTSALMTSDALFAETKRVGAALRAQAETSA